MALGELRSLTLLRTPKYEFILDESERGVSVSDEDLDQDDDEDVNLLQTVELYDDEARIVCQNCEYQLDLQFVCEEETSEAKRVLNLMNFDRRFGLFGA